MMPGQFQGKPKPAENVMGMIEELNSDEIENWFTYHPPTGRDIEKYKTIRAAGLNLARVINELCPAYGADKAAAIHKVREAVMTANAAIACCGKP